MCSSLWLTIHQACLAVVALAVGRLVKHRGRAEVVGRQGVEVEVEVGGYMER